MHLYGQYCPVVLADRWTLLIVRELLADVDHFNELERGLPGISRSLLAERLRLLVDTGVADRRAAERGRRVEYRLTAAGRDLKRVIDVLGDWGAHWAFGEPRTDELDPIVLLWWMRRRVCFDRISRRRVFSSIFRDCPGVIGLCLNRRKRRSACNIRDSGLICLFGQKSPPFTASGSGGGRCPKRWPAAFSGLKARRLTCAAFRVGSPGAQWPKACAPRQGTSKWRQADLSLGPALMNFGQV